MHSLRLAVIALTTLACAYIAFPRSDPGETSVHIASLTDHNEQGGRSGWKCDDDHTAQVTLGAGNPLFSSFLIAKCPAVLEPDREYGVTIQIRYQAKPIGVSVPPGQHLVTLQNITLASGFADDVNFGITQLVHTVDPFPHDPPVETWYSCDALVMPGTLPGSAIMGAGFQFYFDASLPTDAEAFARVHISFVLSPR